ncbi:hypothetical protein FRC14_003219 [Serendipita sp. 396]|nr:hypothetical protein FRC14_003219 [Serendipita sp. 396]KAG8784025.1 hypothetical protein FRC15_004147 [Serendipita sp. 397]KAG8799586.1 hypothetical protein FRC16_004788 [Serendipita sp. 398]KAG8824614.1 hypothetical protein FRC19_001400 [Serendipita sp. 401]KAG8831377.1 hypothetical protein FRC18_006646 [Serendipita sp. 400]KAG8867689.1 hypothetical protein FRC20_005127 [Serendipita sp. 405]KAG9055672.1 hypothetical protein FS842_001529 [Serendipita sp. 407]
MSGRQGGKLKPLKAAKKVVREDDEDDAALKAKLKREAAELKAAQSRAQQGMSFDSKSSTFMLMRILPRNTRGTHGWWWHQEIWQEITIVASEDGLNRIRQELCSISELAMIIHFNLTICDCHISSSASYAFLYHSEEPLISPRTCYVQAAAQ